MILFYFLLESNTFSSTSNIEKIFEELPKIPNVIFSNSNNSFKLVEDTAPTTTTTTTTTTASVPLKSPLFKSMPAPNSCTTYISNPCTMNNRIPTILSPRTANPEQRFTMLNPPITVTAEIHKPPAKITPAITNNNNNNTNNGNDLKTKENVFIPEENESVGLNNFKSTINSSANCSATTTASGKFCGNIGRAPIRIALVPPYSVANNTSETRSSLSLPATAENSSTVTSSNSCDQN